MNNLMANQPILAQNNQFNNKTHPLVSVDAVGGLGLGGYVTLSQGWTLGQPKGCSNEFPEKTLKGGSVISDPTNYKIQVTEPRTISIVEFFLPKNEEFQNEGLWV